MRHNREERNRPYTDNNKDYENTHRSHNDWSYHSGYDADMREASREYSRDRSRQTNYDHEAARHSRGLRDNSGHQDSNRELHYLGDRRFTNRHSGRNDYSENSKNLSSQQSPLARDDYRNQQDFSRSNGGDMDRGRLYGSYPQQNHNRGLNSQGRQHNPERSSEGYSRNNFYSNERSQRHQFEDQDRHSGYNRAREMDRRQDYGRRHNNNDDSRPEFYRHEPHSVKDKYSSSYLHYSGITSLGENNERDRDRYEGSRYIGRQGGE